jgi:hypothetical protein
MPGFDTQVKAAGAFVLNGALAPAASEARLVQAAAVDGTRLFSRNREGKMAAVPEDVTGSAVRDGSRL